jgi:Arc/MetJ family transcription regulator
VAVLKGELLGSANLVASASKRAERRLPGYTHGMKTAISIPDQVFAEAERLARRLKKSRSELYSRALREYVARHGPEYITETLDQICGESPTEKDFVRAAARRTLRRSRW